MRSPFRPSLIFLLIFAVLGILAPIIWYVITFQNHPIASKPSEFEAFANYFGGMLNPIIALLTLGVTVLIAFYLKRIDDDNIKKSTGASYKPELSMESDVFYTESPTPSRANKHKVISQFEMSKVSLANENLISLHSVDIINIGIGTAKGIKIFFDSNFVEKCLNVLSELGKRIPEKDRILIDIFPISLRLTSESLNLNMGVSTNIQNETVTIAHLLPFSISQQRYTLKFPSYVTHLYTTYLYYRTILNLYGETEKVLKFPTVNMEVFYQDIGGTQLQNSFIIEFEILSLSIQNSQNRLRVIESHSQTGFITFETFEYPEF